MKFFVYIILLLLCVVGVFALGFDVRNHQLPKFSLIPNHNITSFPIITSVVTPQNYYNRDFINLQYQITNLSNQFLLLKDNTGNSNLSEEIIIEMQLIKGDVQTLKTQKETLDTQIKTLEDNKTIVQNDIDLIKSDVQILKDNNTILQNSIELLKIDVQTLKEENKILKTELCEYNKEFKFCNEMTVIE